MKSFSELTGSANPEAHDWTAGLRDDADLMAHLTVTAMKQNERMRRTLSAVRDELLERIDGATETRNRDTWISELIRTCEAAL